MDTGVSEFYFCQKMALIHISVPTLHMLKEYYEIVGESRPLSAFFPTQADFFTEIHFYP